ncbi:acetamidase/formamidase family protein [Xanthomonas sontii]|uniref:acetamidase/formamidase family protein n=1 Tax=Xanthomonas sontii TaxID=2650745 RepID=UPI003F82963F
MARYGHGRGGAKGMRCSPVRRRSSVGGGNMDFNAVVAGSTVYLPVQQPGALPYLGDGHTVQGDGEATQWSLET